VIGSATYLPSSGASWLRCWWTWYQAYASQKEFAAAELERAKSIKQSAIAIVEEQVLNAKKLELDRLARLIDQRRRDEKISVPITASEVVEQAEFKYCE